jgi:aspartate aminotransferase
MTEAARKGKTHYVPTSGIPELREAARRKLARVNGIELPGADAVTVTNGAMHGLHVVFAALLDDGDEVLLPDPMWTEVAENVRLAGGVAVGVPLRAAEGYHYSAAEIEARVTPRTRAVFVNTPHNPTGAVLDRDALLAILDVAHRRGLWVVSDEAYEDVLYAPHAHHSLAALAQQAYGVGSDTAARVVTIQSFSKSHAMSGVRVGLVATPHPLLGERLPKIARCTVNNVNSLAQWGAVAALDGPQTHLPLMREAYAERRALMLDALAGVDGVRAFAPEGGFFVWAELDPSVYARLGTTDADALCDRLADAGIGSAPGAAFTVDRASRHRDDALRFSFSCDTAMVREGVTLLRAALGGAPVASAAPPAASSRPRARTAPEAARSTVGASASARGMPDFPASAARSANGAPTAPLDATTLQPPQPRVRQSAML